VYRNDAWRAVKALAKKGVPFDLIFLDPPYAMQNMDELLLEMDSRGLIADGATAVIEHAEDTRYPDVIGCLERVRLARYGETALSVYRAAKSGASEESKALNTTERGIEP
jgi:16S rRNA (guanine966-N2)-methyltransferase